MMESEKQISVDPISLTKFMSCSLPNSASSSPCFDLAFTKHKKKHKIHESRMVLPLARQHSVALVNLERLRESHLRRSKSCGEGRACQPSVDFDLWSKMETQVGAEVVRSYRKEEEVEPHDDDDDIASQRVSLEKFECGSWRSSAAGATSRLFFDLPVELIRCSSVNDAESPVTTGFVFDNHHHNRKGVLKSTSTCSSRRSQELSSVSNSSRHVRFSTSSPRTPTSPSCITPRLHKARDDFNAFLEAQSA